MDVDRVLWLPPIVTRLQKWSTVSENLYLLLDT